MWTRSDPSDATDPPPPEEAARARRATLAMLRAAIGAGSGADTAEAGRGERLPLGDPAADRMLGGGWPLRALAEIRTDAARDAGAALGFALGLAAMLGATRTRPLLWIAPAVALGEAGYPYLPGLAEFGLAPDALVVVRTRRLEEAVWAGEEAARSGAAALTLLEAPGNPRLLGLEGTRRLHLRASESGRPLLLLRLGARPETTAAPLRLHLRAGAAGAVAGCDARLPGTARFHLSTEKGRGPAGRSAHLEWDPHDQRFRTPTPGPLSGRVSAEAPDRPDPPRAGGAVVAIGGGGGGGADHGIARRRLAS